MFFISRRPRGAEVPPRFVSRRHRGAAVPPRFISRRPRGAEVLRSFFFFHVRCFLFHVAPAVLRFRRGSFHVATAVLRFRRGSFHVATAVLRFRRGSFHVAPAVLRFFVFFFLSRPMFFISRRPRGAEVPPRFVSHRHRGAEVLRIFFCFTSDVFLFHVATAVLRFRRGSFHVSPAVPKFSYFFLFHVATAVQRFRRGSFHVAPRGAEVLRIFFCFTSDVFLFHVATAVLRFSRGSFHVAPAVLRFFGISFLSRRHRGAAVPPRFVSRRPRGAEVLRIFFCFTSDVFLFHVATAVLRFRRGSFHVAPAVLSFCAFFFCFTSDVFLFHVATAVPRFRRGLISRRRRGAAVPPRFISRRPRGAEVLRIFFCFTSDVFLFHVSTAVLRFRRGSFHVAPAVLRFFVFFFVSRPMFFCFTSPPRC